MIWWERRTLGKLLLAPTAPRFRLPRFVWIPACALAVVTIAAGIQLSNYLLIAPPLLLAAAALVARMWRVPAAEFREFGILAFNEIELMGPGDHNAVPHALPYQLIEQYVWHDEATLDLKLAKRVGLFDGWRLKIAPEYQRSVAKMMWQRAGKTREELARLGPEPNSLAADDSSRGW